MNLKTANSLMATLLLLFLAPLPAAAQTTSSAETTFTGFVDLFAAWNPNEPANHENFFPGAGTSAKRANEFGINLVQVQWTRPTSDENPLGFTVALVAGEGTEVVHGGEPGGPGKSRYVYQASVSWKLENGLLLEGGIFPSHIGMEGFYSKDNWNYTRSIIGEASPYYQTGIKASYAFNDRWSGRVDLVNGWQLINDHNDGKSLGTQLAYSGDALTASLNTFFGPELPGDDDSLRKFVDVVALYRPSPALQIGGTVDFGSQEVPGGGDAEWNGAGVYGRYAVSPRNALALRAERFSDPDNGITGAAQTVREATLTWEARPRENLIVKIEGRYDRSDADVFFDDQNTTDSQFLVLAGVVMTF
jgi:hypothetical protein